MTPSCPLIYLVIFAQKFVSNTILKLFLVLFLRFSRFNIGRGVGPVIWGQLALRQMYATLTTGQKEGAAPHVGFAKARHDDETAENALEELTQAFAPR